MRLTKSRNLFVSGLIAAAAAVPLVAAAADITIPVHQISAEGVGASIGVVKATDTPDGLQLTPELTQLSPGLHGFHVHQNGSCETGTKDGKPVAGLAAGGHWDPDNTGTHAGPYGQGHKGDLPVLAVAADGTATTPVVAPRLTVADLSGHSLMIHAGGDTYSDVPPLGGGGARVACGVVP